MDWSETTHDDMAIRVIGDRASGKTTYMASLAYWPYQSPASSVQKVEAINEDGKKLLAKAENILMQGLMIEPTDLDASPDDVKDYAISITLKDQFSLAKLITRGNSSMLTISISCKDYAGEFFADLISQTGDRRFHDYLHDCQNASGIMLLVDGTCRKDLEYASSLDKFLPLISQDDITSKIPRIAFVLTKCEQMDLWISRHDPRQMARRRFKRTYEKLEAWRQSGRGNVDYFATSAFGMLGHRRQEPNSRLLDRGANGVISVIKMPNLWRPFGLVSPIYWLFTGNRHEDLDRE